MNDFKRDRLSGALRELSLNIEKAAYELSETLAPDLASEMLEMSARLCNAADVVENPELMEDANDDMLSVTKSHPTQRTSNDRMNGKH